MIVRVQHLPPAHGLTPGEVEIHETPSSPSKVVDRSIRFGRIGPSGSRQFGLIVASLHGLRERRSVTSYLLARSFHDLEEYCVWLRSEILRIDVDGVRWWDNPDPEHPPVAPKELKGPFGGGRMLSSVEIPASQGFFGGM